MHVQALTEVVEAPKPGSRAMMLQAQIDVLASQLERLNQEEEGEETVDNRIVSTPQRGKTTRPARREEAHNQKHRSR